MWTRLEPAPSFVCYLLVFNQQQNVLKKYTHSNEIVGYPIVCNVNGLGVETDCCSLEVSKDGGGRNGKVWTEKGPSSHFRTEKAIAVQWCRPTYLDI